MYLSSYIPVKEDTADGKKGVFYSTKYFDAKLLSLAVALASDPDSSIPGVKLSMGNIYFDETPDVSWPTYEIFMANKVLTVAEDTGFWFTPIYDNNGVPQLYVSIPFHERVVIVNALTNHTLLLRNKVHIAAVRQLVSGKESYIWLQRMFMMLESIDTNTAKVLSAVRVTTPEGDQYMVTNPYVYPYRNGIRTYGVDVLDELRELLSGKKRKTESFEIGATGIRRKDMPNYPIITRDSAKVLIETYDTLIENKSNYIAIYDGDMEDYLYWSTNRRYLVRADSLECVVVTAENIKNLLSIVSDGGANDTKGLDLIWRLASQL